MNLADLWLDLEADLPKGAGGRTIRRIHSDSGVDLFLGVEIRSPSDRNRRTLELQVIESALEQETPKNTKQVIVLVEPRDAGRVGLVLALEDPGARDLFTALVEDVAEVAAGRGSDREAVPAFLGRFAKWQRMFQLAPEGLVPRRQRGLFGELITIRDHLIPRIGFNEAVLAWKGPDGAPRDFEVLGNGVEIKTSAANEPQIVPVHGERQLDDSGLETLLLIHYSLEVIRDAAENLPAAVASIRALGAGLAELGTFEDRLIQSGYADVHAPLYRRIGYANRRLSVFTVSDGFPRIIESDLIDGVGAVRYSLAIDACRQFEVPVDSIDGFIGDGE